ncbi:MAG: thioesterase family protein [Bacteroidetes bacterium]|nr:thioesterase family protein [Bacteroidota bacterium]MBS1610681.1 thioesterase family protein [Bacteroidota bacterium]
MPRIKIDLPGNFIFSTDIPVRITDINYGGHVGNDTILSILHEARMQFFNRYGYSELNCGGVGLIMSDAAIEFKNELFYGDTIIASVAATGFSKVTFEIYYKLEKQTGDKKSLIVIAKTGMVCFDYTTKKIAPVPQEVKDKLGQ